MRVPLLFLSFFMFTQIVFTQITVNNLSPSEEHLPLDYFGHLEVNGVIPLKHTAVPNDFAVEIKYWLNKSPSLKSSLGFGWQMGFNESYATSTTNFAIDGLAGNELSYLYNYLSLRYKLIQGQRKIRPYAEFGGGWLFMTDKFVDRPLNPDYDPNHSCPNGSDEYLRETRLIRAQNRLAVDVEAGINFYLSDKASLNIGIGSILTNPIAHLTKGYDPVVLENGRHQATQSYQFKQRALHSTSLKIGVALLLFTNPNIIREKSDDDYFLIDDFGSSDSCN